MRRPVFQLIADVGSGLLLVLLVLIYSQTIQVVPAWLMTLVWIVAAVVLLATLYELYTIVRDYRAGVFFPMRNASFFVLLLTVFGLPAYVVYLYASGQPPGPEVLLVVPVAFAFATRNLFFMRLDEVSLRAKTGFRLPVEVPIFNIERVTEDERRITVAPRNGRPIHLIQAFFFPAHWEALRERLASLGK